MTDEVVTFCASGYRAAHTWLVLTLLGYRNVRHYAGGKRDWVGAGLPVEGGRQGSPPLALFR